MGQQRGRARGLCRPRDAGRPGRDRPYRVRGGAGDARRPAQHPPDQAACGQVRRSGDRRYRAVRAGPRTPAATQGRRHYRHQRQEHDHCADASYTEDRGRTDHDGRQYRPADPRPGSLAGRRRLCAGTVELPDRPDFQSRLRGRGAAQCDPRSSRPLRELRGLRRKQIAPVRNADARSQFYCPVHGCTRARQVCGRLDCEHPRGRAREPWGRAE